MSEIIPQNQHISDSNFLKREQFSVSLRTQKKKDILAQKRVKTRMHLTKAKFFYTQESKEKGLEVKDIAHVIEIIEAMESSLRPEFHNRPELSFSLEDIIQILKEMKYVAENNDQNSRKLISHQSSSNILLVLLTKDYQFQNQNEPGYITVEDFKNLQKLVCQTLTAIIGSDYFDEVTDQICKNYNILNVMNQILKMYFLESDLDFGAELLEEMIFATNNFIAHQYQDHENTSQYEKSIQVGLHTTYSQILQKYQGEHIKNLAWGFSNMVFGLQSYKDGQNFEEFKFFIQNCFDNKYHKTYEKNEEFEHDLLRIVAFCSIRMSPEDQKAFIFRSEIEIFAFEMLKLKDPRTIDHCLLIIGQFAAQDDSTICQKFMEDFKLLEHLQWVLVECQIKVRTNAIWVLQNLACTTDTANFMLKQGIIPKVLHEIPRLKTNSAHKIKMEVAHLLANLLRYTDSEDHVKYLVKENILGILNEELLSNGNSPMFMILALECLSLIFTKLPEIKQHFIKTYDVDVFEKCQHGHSDEVYDATIKLLDEHFECKEEIIEDEPENNDAGGFNI